MGAVDTTYTFTATDTITSTKMNNIIDQTTMTGDAIIGNTLEVASGKLKVRSLGITSNEIADSNVITVKIADANVTQAKLAANVVGNGPAFSARPSSNQSIATATDTKVNLGTEEFDTNNNFASSRFTPTVAGYYILSAWIGVSANDVQDLIASIVKSGGADQIVGNRINGVAYSSTASGLFYMNGSTDYVELYVRHLTGSARSTLADQVKFQGCLIRSA